MRAGIALDVLSMVEQKGLPSTNRLPKIPSPDCVFLLSVMYILLWLNSKHDAKIIQGISVLQIFMSDYFGDPTFLLIFCRFSSACASLYSKLIVKPRKVDFLSLHVLRSASRLALVSASCSISFAFWET